MALLAISLAATATPPEYTEDEVKAALLFNFALYTEWPEDAASRDALTICLAGVEEPRSFLGVLEDRALEDRTVAVRTIDPGDDDLSDCGLLFLRSDRKSDRDRILAQSRDRAILTVGEDSSFLRDGGHLAVVREGERVRFDVSLRNLERSGLRLSSRVVRLARAVLEDEPEGSG